MHIEVEQHERTLVIHIEGDIDHHTAEDAKNKIDNEYGRMNGKNMVIDLAAVTFMDSSAIGMIIGRYKNVEKQGGFLTVASLGINTKRIFQLSGLHKIIKTYDTIEEALLAKDK